MTQRTLLTLLLLTFPSTLALGDPLQVFQPIETSYSAVGLAVFLPALDQLGEVLNNDTNLGSQRIFRPHDWDSFGFSAYTSGTLEEHGYTTRPVAAGGWPDWVHMWVLVATLPSERTAWSPVEGSPNLGEARLTLGIIPTNIDPAGRLWAAPPYRGINDEIRPPANSPPVAVLRTDTTRTSVDQAAIFVAMVSCNPDREIIRCCWDLGDGASAQARSVLHPFKEAGDYTISLTVTDSRGASDTTSATPKVAEPRVTSYGCGCEKRGLSGS